MIPNGVMMKHCLLILSLALIASPAITAPALAQHPAPAQHSPPPAGAKNVLDFGAVCNGTTDDTAAIRAANAAIPPGGGVLYFPPGHVCGVTGAIYLGSNTHVVMYGTTLLDIGGHIPFFQNIHHTATTLTDHDITIEGGTLDYGRSGAGGGTHAISMLFVNHVKVLNITGQGRGAGDFTAFVGCNDTLVEGASGFDFVNATYDHWWGPTNARVINSYACTTSTAQMVNFNPERTSGNSTGLSADGFVLSGNTFVCTKECPIIVAPLGPGTTAQHITVSNNHFTNVWVTARGATDVVSISGNTFRQTVDDGAAPVDVYVMNGGTPNHISVDRNDFIDPHTGPSSQAVIRLVGANSSITGNTVSGTKFYAATFTGKEPVVISGNSFPRGLHGYVNTGSAWLSASPAGATAPGNHK